MKSTETKIRIALIVAAFIVLVVPVTADAQHGHLRVVHAKAIRQNPTQAALAIAYRYWGQTPCGGHVTVVMATPLANTEHNGAYDAMWASWHTTTGIDNLETAPQPFTGCVIGINPAVWTTEAYAAFAAWPEFSVRLIHEVGHLLGYGHSTDTTSIMFPEPSAHVGVTGEYAPGWG